MAYLTNFHEVQHEVGMGNFSFSRMLEWCFQYFSFCIIADICSDEIAAGSGSGTGGLPLAMTRLTYVRRINVGGEFHYEVNFFR